MESALTSFPPPADTTTTEPSADTPPRLTKPYAGLGEPSAVTAPELSQLTNWPLRKSLEFAMPIALVPFGVIASAVFHVPSFNRKESAVIIGPPVGLASVIGFV